MPIVTDAQGNKSYEPDDKGPWVHVGAGRYRSAMTGRLKYLPGEDPAWVADMKRRGAVNPESMV